MEIAEMKRLYEHYLKFYNTDLVSKYSLMEFISVLWEENKKLSAGLVKDYFEIKEESKKLKVEIERLENELTGYKLSNQSLSNALDKQIKENERLKGLTGEKQEWVQTLTFTSDYKPDFITDKSK